MASVARLLALAFAPPDDDGDARIAAIGDALLRDLPEGPLGGAVAGLLDAIPDDAQGCTARGAEHHRLFGGNVACPPYETSYAPDPFQQARQMSDVAGFYAAFGATADGPANDRPDQVGCQLEFLAYLMAQRLRAAAEGRPADAAVCAAAEADFLREHLGRWLGPFCLELERATEHPWYAAVARLGQRFAVEELDRRGLHADPVLARRIRTVVERDTFDCGAEGGPAAALNGVLGRGERARGGP
ncbi:MAG: molecular chaperone TorD family protein [Thermoleophilia bacterium]